MGQGKIFPNLNKSFGRDPRTLDPNWNDPSEFEKSKKDINPSVAKSLRRKKQKSPDLGKHVAQTIINIQAEHEDRKKLSIKDLMEIDPLTDNQEEAFNCWDQEYNVVLAGSAGVGKTFIGLHMALDEVLQTDSLQTKVVIIRSAVPSRDMGFMPGSEEEKMAMYERPYIDNFSKLFGKKTAYEHSKKYGLVEFMTTSYLRGETIDNAIVIADEIQNMSDQEINTIMTRLGKNTRIILCGDQEQADLEDDDPYGGNIRRRKDQITGFREFLQYVEYMPSMKIIHFDEKDIVRGGVCKEWIIARRKAESAFNSRKKVLQ